MVFVLLAAISANMLMDRWGIYEPSRKDANLFYQTITWIQKSSVSWIADATVERMVRDVEMKAASYKGNALSIAIYEGTEQVYTWGNFSENALFEVANKQPQEHHYTMGRTALYSVDIGDYRLYLMNTNQEYGEENTVMGENDPFPYDVILIALIVLLANRILNKSIVKSIVGPLTILVDGVHEIRDGNLNYRIEYNQKDEFAGICDDFNEMARQLQKLMEARRKDDENRRELIAGISHDLRTPLTSIKAYAEGLIKGVASTPLMQDEYLQIISDAAGNGWFGTVPANP